MRIIYLILLVFFAGLAYGGKDIDNVLKLLENTDEKTAIRIIEGISNYDKNDAKKILFTALKNKAEKVRIKVCLMLVKYKDDDVIKILQNLAIHDKSKTVNIIASETLYRLNYKQAINLIINEIKEDNLKIALFATFRLQFIEDQDIILKFSKIKTNSDVLNNRIKKTIKIINGEIKLKDIEEAQNMIDKAYLSFESKKYSESLKHVNEALKLDPTNPDAYWIMANVELLKDKTSSNIVEQLKKAISYGFIEQSTALFSLGTVLLNQKKIEEAIHDLKKAAEYQPDPVIYYQLGVAYSYINKKDDAINATKNAVKLDPEYTLAHYNLSLLYDSIGDKEKASAHLKKYNSLKTKTKK